MVQFFAQVPFWQLSSKCQPWCFRIVFGVPRGHPTHGKRLLNCINLESGQFRGRSIWTMTALMIASTWDLDTFEGSCRLQYAKNQIASTWDLDTFEDSDPMPAMRSRIVSTWDLVNSEGYGGWVKDDFMFINLGSGELRGLVCRADHSLGHCINLESGTKTRTRQNYSRCAKRLYQPGIWTPSKTDKY